MLSLQGVCLAYDWFIVARVNPFVLLQKARSVKNHHRQERQVSIITGHMLLRFKIIYLLTYLLTCCSCIL